MGTPLVWPMITRTPQNPGGSSYENQGYTPVRWFEARYITTGPQQWIFGPGDSQPWAVAIYFLSGAGSAFIEGTDEGPSDIANATGYSIPNVPPNPTIVGPGNIHTYALTDTVTDTTRVIVRCCTAVRVNVLGGTVDVTVTC